MKITIEGRKVEVSDSFRDLSPEEQAKTVEEIAAQMNIAPQRDSQRGLPGALNTVNEGIARGLGAPVDLVAAGLDRLGLDTGDAPLGGSESIRRGMRAIGSDPIDRDPETWGERALMGAGEGAGVLLPAGAIGRGLQAAGGLAGRAGDTLMRPFVSTPARAMGAEVAAGAGARVGGEAAARGAESDNPLIRAGGELAGGLAAAAGPGAALRTAGRVAQSLPVTGAVIRGVKGAVAPFTEAGARVRAEDRVRGLVADPEATVRALEGDSIGGLTPAQRANDPNLLALERTVMDANPSMRDELVERQAESTRTLRDEFDAPADGATTDEARDFIAQRRETFRNRLTARLDAANERAQQRVQRLAPARRESENAVIVRQEIDRAYDSAVLQERSLWGRVPKNAAVPTGATRAAYAEILAETGRARAQDIPPEARDLLGSEDGFASTETVREMHALYSQLRQRAREAMSGAAPNENRARIANSIADAILEDLGATGGLPTNVGQSINEARAFSRVINEVFGQGTVGRLTSRQRNGGEAVAPEASLAGSVGSGGVRGAVAVDDIRGAVGGAADVPLDDYLRGRLMDTASPRGQFRPERAEDFARYNRETLERFPELQGDIGAASTASRQAASQADRVKRMVSTLDNPRENVGAAFLNAAPGDEIAAAVFQARNPVRAANQVRRQAAKDPSGRALDGVKGGFLDHLMRKAFGAFDSQGRREVSGNALFGDLQDSRTRAALAQVFEPQELSRMDRIAREFQGLEGARKAGTLDAVIDDAPNAVISLIARTIAARQGARAGQGTSGASLLTANFASRRMQKILDSLTNDRAEALIRDAITDRDLFVALMNKSGSPAARRMVETRLTEWLIGTAGVQASEVAAEGR